VAEISAARIRPDADLGAEPVRLDEPAGWRSRWLGQPAAVAGQTGLRHRQAECAEHGAGAEFVLAECKQRIIGAEQLQAVQPCQRRRRTAAEIGDTVGQRPHQRRLRILTG
jgi:hypothetical protein